jgi:signal peptidase II
VIEHEWGTGSWSDAQAAERWADAADRLPDRLLPMTAARRFALIAVILVLCVGCDQGTKVLASQYLADTGGVSLLGDTLRFQYSENPGAMLSVGAQLPEWARFWVFGVFVAAVLVGLLWYVVRDTTLAWTTVVGLSLVLGGGVSNLIDRLSNDGAVIDFMNIGIGGLRTGIFNVADIAIFGGVGLFLWHHLRQPADDDSSESGAGGEGSAEPSHETRDQPVESEEAARPDEGEMNP